MLVTLGTNRPIGAGATEVFTYSPSSVQKIFIKVDDTNGTTAYDHTVNVQLGSTTLVNTASAYGMFGMSQLTGGMQIGNYASEMAYQIDLGSHIALSNQQLYVSITAGAGALDGVDVSALINCSGSTPVRYTEYTANTFAQQNCLSAIGYAGVGVAVDEVVDTCEIRTDIFASSPTFASGNSWYANSGIVHGNNQDKFSRLLANEVPMNTSFNYTSSTITRILTASLMPTSSQERAQSGQMARVQRSAN